MTELPYATLTQLRHDRINVIEMPALGGKADKVGILARDGLSAYDPERPRSIVGRRLVAGRACQMQRVDAERNKVHQYRRSQERARNALTDQEEVTPSITTSTGPTTIRSSSGRSGDRVSGNPNWC